MPDILKGGLLQVVGEEKRLSTVNRVSTLFPSFPDFCILPAIPMQPQCRDLADPVARSAFFGVAIYGDVDCPEIALLNPVRDIFPSAAEQFFGFTFR